MAQKRVLVHKEKDRKKNEDIHVIKSIDQLMMWVIVLALGLLPLLLKFKVNVFIAPKIEYDILNTHLVFEGFAYYKWFFLVFLSVAALVLLLIKIFVYRYQIRRSYINIPLFILASFILLSGATAEYPGVSILGTSERYEGTVTYLCYFTLFFAAANTNFKKNAGLFITAALGALVVVNAVIISFFFFGSGLFVNNQFFKSIFIPEGLPPELIPRGTINSTLGNQNYVSGLASALAAFFLTASLLVGNLRQRLAYAALFAVSFFLILASFSTSGFVSLLAALPVIAIIVYLKVKNRIHILKAAAIFVVFCLIMFTALYRYNPGIWDETLGFFTPSKYNKVVDILPESQQKQSHPPASIDNELHIEKQVATLSSGRSYIWAKTIELIAKKPLLGYGLDTLAYYFPQGDPMRARYLGADLVDKPHNMYLGIAFGSGIIALCALIALMTMHLYHAARRLLQANKKGEETCLKAALLCFIFTFLVQWLFNDSIIATSTVFWTLAGVSSSLITEEDNI